MRDISELPQRQAGDLALVADKFAERVAVGLRAIRWIYHPLSDPSEVYFGFIACYSRVLDFSKHSMILSR